MGEIMDAAEAMWHGARRGPNGVLEAVAPRTWFYAGFANVVVRETDDGLIIIDPGAFNNAREKFAAIRGVTAARAHTIIYTHGHADHMFGADLYAAEAQAGGWPSPTVIAHEAILARMQRYRLTAGFNALINRRQFQGGQGEPYWPTDYYPPDITYQDRLELRVGGVTARLRHARGETDDVTWVHFPDDGIIAAGDLFIWVAPNAGNPQKVQRYARDWAVALREMAALDAELLLPGHGMPIVGRARIRQALVETAEWLESLHDQTVAMMNQGATLDEVIHTVRPPAHLADRPYLRPTYDEPEFVVRNVWRLYGGWWDGVPSHLKPAPEAAQASVIAELAGGATNVAQRALGALAEDDLRLAGQLADWAYFAAPDDEQVRDARRQVYKALAADARSTMAIGIYSQTAREMGEEQTRGSGRLWSMRPEG